MRAVDKAVAAGRRADERTAPREITAHGSRGVKTTSRTPAAAARPFVDVTAVAREVGILRPAVLTYAVWKRCVCTRREVGYMAVERCKAMIVLWAYRHAARRSAGPGEAVCEAVCFTVGVRSRERRMVQVALRAVNITVGEIRRLTIGLEEELPGPVSRAGNR